MVIEKEIGKAFAISQEQRRTEKLKNIDDILPFGSKYNPNSSKVFPNIQKLQNLKIFQNIC